MNRKELLINILLDSNASDSERDDSAIDLSEFDGDEVINVLFMVGNDLSIEEMIRASCGESLAQIWVRNDKIDINKLSQLEDVALVEALAIIKNEKHEWYQQYKDKKSNSFT